MMAISKSSPEAKFIIAGDPKQIPPVVDVDDNEEMVMTYGIRNIPTLIFIKDNQIVDRISGTISKEALINKINELDCSVN